MTGGNTLHPLQIEDAREAAFKASELQRACEERLSDAGRKLAAAERAYRLRLSERIVELRGDKVAWTACGDLARGKEDVAQLRYERDVAAGVMEAARQEAFRRAADRRAVLELLRWSQARDLRTDTPPARDQDWEPAIGGRR